MTGRILIGFLAAVVTNPGLYAQETSADSRLRHAQEAFQDIMNSPDKGIPQDLIDDAQCVVIVPDLVKAGFIVGGQYGRGFASCRHGNGWSAPAAMRMEGGSVGLQIGGASTDLIMLIMNRRGMDRLLGDKFTIGGDITGAAGPVGRQINALTDAQLHAQILTWSRSRGLFGGISLNGSTLRPDKDENTKLYGHEITNREILETGVTTPSGGRPFVAMLDKFSPGETAAVAERLDRPSGSVTLSERQVHFATGKSDIPAEANATLTDLAKAMKDHSAWTIRIEGYTDNVGGKDFNQKLSEDRASSVANWLEQHGVDKGRITTKGYGESRPIADNSTDEGKAQNRRVEIVRTDKTAPKG